MCFNVKSDEKTAAHPILVCKFIEQNNLSYFRNFRYKRFTTYRLKKKLKVKCHEFTKRPVIHNGFHSYALRSDMYKLESMYPPPTKMCLFVIPKGAKYYYNKENKAYVSTSIQSLSLENIRLTLEKD